MIGVLVTFRYGDDFDERAVRKIAETARVPPKRSSLMNRSSG